ncbi:MAG: DUF6340 family protein [Paludibacteraceae bacterium]
MKKYIYLLFIPGVFLLTGCSQYGYVRLNYPVKPVAQFPNNASKIALINRSLPMTSDEASSAAESLTTGEVAGSDEKASFEALKGVYKTLDEKKGISIRILNVKLYGKGTRKMPDQLDWNKVKSICDSTKTDLLLSLEIFDSNSDIISSNVQKIVRVLSGGFPSLPKVANVDVMHVWKLYDPSTKNVIEQYDGMRYFKMVKINSEQLNAAAYDAGVEYIRRYLPVYFPVKRRFYKKGKGQENDFFQTAFRRTQTANWVNAIEDWEEIVKTGSIENAGRAAFNIAVAYEVLDKTNQALDWAKRSFEDFGEKPGREYYNILQKRAEIELR